MNPEFVVINRVFESKAITSSVFIRHFDLCAGCLDLCSTYKIVIQLSLR